MQRIAPWIVLAVILISLIILGLLTGSWGELITHLLVSCVGAFVGSFLMLGAFRLLDWGESAARSIVWGVGVGGAIIWVILPVVLDDALSAPQPSLASIALWTTLGVVIGSVSRAAAIRKQLRTEDGR